MISEAWRQQFMTEGYLVVPDVIPSNLQEKAIDATLAFTGVRLDDTAGSAGATDAGTGGAGGTDRPGQEAGRDRALVDFSRLA